MKCSFCRNEPANNEHPYEGDFVFFMCDDCNTRYLEHKQLGPKFLVCNCDPDHPREIELDMAIAEMKANPKEYTALDKIKDEGLESKLYKDENVNEFEESGFTKKRKKV